MSTDVDSRLLVMLIMVHTDDDAQIIIVHTHLLRPELDLTLHWQCVSMSIFGLTDIGSH